MRSLVPRQSVASALAVILLAACQGSAPAAPSAEPSTPQATSSGSAVAQVSPPGSPSPSASWSPPTTPIRFVSERYGYVVELPAGWFVREEGSGSWTPSDLDYVGPGTDSFEEDYPGRGGSTIDFPGVTYGLYISSADAANATSEQWTEMLATTMRQDSSCQGEPDREQAMIAAEPATLLVYDRSDCTHDHHIILAGLLHDDAGYALMWLARRGEPDIRRADFEAILRTFRFDG